MSDAQPQFDVFLCHNSEDKEAVIKIAEQLKYEHNIESWLDDWELRPGFPWQPELERQIAHIKSAAVFVGKSGIGPWQSQEIYGFLSEFQRRKCPVIPVLLPDAPQQPQLPIFLRGMTWVDFREQTRVYTPAMDKLIWGITGIKPKVTVKVIPQSPTQNTLQNQRDDSSDDLSSEKGVDYTKLRDLLAAGKWLEADYETDLVMRLALGLHENEWFKQEELLNFPCTDLQTIDRLWVKYSNGRFGFSVQKKIYLSVGSQPDGKYYKEAWEKFGERVGWRREDEQRWISYGSFVFDNSAPEGHLPIGWLVRVLLDWGVWGVWYSSLLSRIKTCQFTEDDLSSEKGVDYTKLRDLLAAGKWKEADYETYLVMLQAVGREENDYIRGEELLNFPCADLRTIDQLWVKNSNGRFGFSVQKKIYLSVGGMPDGEYYEEAWKKFGDRVGWRVRKNWIFYGEVAFDTTTPEGHLPLRVVFEVSSQGWVCGWVVLGGEFWVLFSRIETCKL
jgi:hypothetical protein